MPSKTEHYKYMRLDSLDFAIIAQCYHRPKIAATELAVRLGVRVDTFRRRLDSLLRAEFMRQKAFPDLYALGFCQFEVSLAVASNNQVESAQFIEALRAADDVAWIGQYSGEYQYTFTVCARTPQQFYDSLGRLLADYSSLVVKTQIATRIRYVEFPLSCLSDTVESDTPLEFGHLSSQHIDLIDQAILQQICSDSSVTTRELSRQIAISQAALIQRIRQLEQRKILVGYTYVVDFSKLGMQAFCIVIKVRVLSASLTEKLFNYGRTTASISYIVESFGAYDFKLGVLLRNPAQILPLSQAIAELLGDELLSMQTLTAFDYLKVERYPFKNPTKLPL